VDNAFFSVFSDCYGLVRRLIVRFLKPYFARFFAVSVNPTKHTSCKTIGGAVLPHYPAGQTIPEPGLSGKVFLSAGKRITSALNPQCPPSGRKPTTPSQIATAHLHPMSNSATMSIGFAIARVHETVSTYYPCRGAGVIGVAGCSIENRSAE
jgi:hypothetical protein